MNIFQYILQGIAHEIVLFFNFIDFSWAFFVVLGSLIVIVFIKKIAKNLISVLIALLNVVKIPIVLFGILLILSMYILTAYLFKDTLSFYFVLITIISLIKDIIDFYNDMNSDISLKTLVKTSFSLAKGAFLLLFVRIINLIDIWDFSTLRYTYIYILYLLTLLIFTFYKKLYIIIDDHRCRCRIKGGHYNRIQLLLLYLFSSFYVKDLDISSNMLFAFYNHEHTTSFKVDLIKIKKLSIKLRKIMKNDRVDKALLRRIGVDNYEHNLQKDF